MISAGELMQTSAVQAAALQPVDDTAHTVIVVQFSVHKVVDLAIFRERLAVLSWQRSPLPQYLESVRPLLDNEEYDQMEILANEFKDSKAAQLQRYLILKSWWATNYVSGVQK